MGHRREKGREIEKERECGDGKQDELETIKKQDPFDACSRRDTAFQISPF